MSAVSTANATVAPGLAALLGGAPEGNGLGGSAGKAPSSFGVAFALAERMLDADVGATMPTDAETVAPSAVTVPAEGPDAKASIDVEGEGHAAPDAGLSAAIAMLSAPPVAPQAEPAPHLVAGDEAIPEDAQAASAPRAAQATDVSQMTDADASVIPVASVSMSNVRASDPPTVLAPPAVAATPSAAPDAPVARAEPMPVSAQALSATAASGALPVIPAATPVPKDGSTHPDQPVPPTSAASTSASAPAVSVSPASTPVVAAPDAAAAVPRAVAAQVAPVVLSIVQRPVGSHQLTMTVNPDTLGPVTVRAHISTGGEVRVELLGATDAGREALRTIVTDLRRDLAAVMPHASLTLGSSASADAGNPDRGAQPGSGGAAGEHAPGERGRAAADGRASAESRAGGIPSILPITTRAVSGEGLDIFA
ncbi:hypothetical protein [Microbacterium sp. EST19A]|uniref:hypothetical protein n=1 Tax=Microbacterium sp. EST19A TaxID=2862681 RepID=UPI001CBDE1C9|nr:hypothetical protein [Microbacterium sp. EST19A]